jgi:hypothetical protein
LLKDVLIIDRDESPENPGGVRVLLPYLLADAPGAPKVVRDGETARLVIFDGVKNGCLHDPIWLYRAAEKSETPDAPANPDEPEKEYPQTPSLLVVFPSRFSLRKNESREVTAFVPGEASEPGPARGITWRVENGAVASIEKTAADGELEVWAVTGLKEGYTNIIASAAIFLPDDAAPLSASLGVTVTPDDREPEAAELRRGGCALGMTDIGAGLVLVFGLASGVWQGKRRLSSE